MPKEKRVVAIGDLHSGHIYGLTSPEFNPKYEVGEAAAQSEVRARLWKFYSDTLESLQPIDYLIVNGDTIDGKGEGTGGTELLMSDREKQAEMAVACINAARARNIYMSYGTRYHTGAEEDWEKTVADDCGARKIGSHDFLDVNGLVFDYRHHTTASSIPHGRHTRVALERVWNVLWAEKGEYPKADILLRSHVHYFAYCGGPNWLAMTLPALQIASKFGTRIPIGIVDIGIVSFAVRSKLDYSWKLHQLPIAVAKANRLALAAA